MKGDFSRFTFDPNKHFSAVRLQQGRVQLDADWNEQVDITDHRIATEITDFIGQSGAPEQNAGFQLKPGPAPGTLGVGRGRYYVEGLLFELDQDVPFDGQPDFPGASLPTAEGRYVAYLDAWQHHVTGREDPRLLDPALGDADTATRVRNVAQVKLKPLTDKDGNDSKDFFPPWLPPGESALGSGRLAARMSAPRPTMENQLYRVEIHKGGGPGQATFKWSRDDGAVTARVKSIAGTGIVLRSGGRNAAADFAPNQWVEVISQGQVLRGEPGALAEIAAVQDDTLTVVSWPSGSPPAVDDSTVVRRWDSAPGEIAVATGRVLLEDGIEVVFDTVAKIGGTDVSYRTGDYWVFPSRSLTGTIEWPQSVEGISIPVPPLGIRHRYCALTLLTLKGTQWNVDADLRVVFKPMATGLVSKQGDTINGDLTVLGRVDAGSVNVRGDFGGNTLSLRNSLCIGTPTPKASLQVQAAAGSSLPLAQYSDSQGKALVTFGSEGRLALGADNDAGGMQIDKGAGKGFALQLTSSGGGFGSGLLLKNTSPKGGKSFSIYSNENGALVFGDEDAQRGALLVSKEGNLGVGPQLPTAGLHVQQQHRVGSGTLLAISQEGQAMFVAGKDSKFINEVRAGDILVFDDDDQGTAFAKVKSVESDIRIALEGRPIRLDGKGDFNTLTHRAGGGMPFRVASASLRVSDFRGVTRFEVTAEGNLSLGKRTFGKERALVAGGSTLRIVAGQVSIEGDSFSTLYGGGFTISRNDVQTFTITFSPEFGGTPSISVLSVKTGIAVPVVPFFKSFTVRLPSQTELGFCFTAIGPE
jgi:hypothetical protein